MHRDHFIFIYVQCYVREFIIWNKFIINLQNFSQLLRNIQLKLIFGHGNAKNMMKNQKYPTKLQVSLLSTPLLYRFFCTFFLSRTTIFRQIHFLCKWIWSTYDWIPFDELIRIAEHNFVPNKIMTINNEIAIEMEMRMNMYAHAVVKCFNFFCSLIYCHNSDSLFLHMCNMQKHCTTSKCIMKTPLNQAQAQAQAHNLHIKFDYIPSAISLL